MSTQRRVDPSQRFSVTGKTGTEFTGIAVPTSVDDGAKVQERQFRPVAGGLTASTSSIWFGRRELATNSLSFGSSCAWHFGHRSIGFNESRRVVPSHQTWIRTNGSSPAPGVSRAGILPEQLPRKLSLTSPLLPGVSEQRQRSASCSAFSMQSALPQVLTGVSSRTERQHGQGNMYLQHTARNAACDFGRRSARRDLLRAGK